MAVKKVMLKYPIPDKSNIIDVHVGAYPRYVGFDPIGNMCLWCEVNVVDDQPIESIPTSQMCVAAIGTGEQFASMSFSGYVDTVKTGDFMWHYYWGWI